MVYVSDTNIWIDFRNAGLLTELFRLPFALCCTDFVLDELEDVDRATLLALGLVVETLDGGAMLELSELMRRHNNSSLADVSCYHLARSTARPLLTGDGRLRRQAMQDGIEVRGALWLLDQLVHGRIIDGPRAAEALDGMLAAQARLPQADCQARLTAWRR